MTEYWEYEYGNNLTCRTRGGYIHEILAPPLPPPRRKNGGRERDFSRFSSEDGGGGFGYTYASNKGSLRHMVLNYYDSQLSMTLGKFGNKVSAFKLPCCRGQLPSFPRVTFRALTSRASDAPAKIYEW